MTGFLRVSLIFATFFMIYGSGYDGNPRGLYDMKGKEIVPCQYSEIKYVGHGIFFLKDIDKIDKLKAGTTALLVNKLGENLSYKLPINASLNKVIWLGEKAYSNKNLELKELPNDSLLVFLLQGRLGICDKFGNIIEQADYSYIGLPSDGLVYLRTKVSEEYLFELQSRKLTKLPNELCPNRVLPSFTEGLSLAQGKNNKYGYINKLGKWVIKPKFAKGKPFVNGIALVNLEKVDKTTKLRFGRLTPGVIINRKGKVISPLNLDIFDFYGNYAVVRVNDTDRFGIVNKQFKFVVEPKYAKLYMASGSITSWTENAYYLERFKSDPELIVATLPGPKQIALSPNGQTIFEFPEGYGYHHMFKNFITCLPNAKLYRSGVREGLAIDLSGKIIGSACNYN